MAGVNDRGDAVELANSAILSPWPQMVVESSGLRSPNDRANALPVFAYY